MQTTSYKSYLFLVPVLVGVGLFVMTTIELFSVIGVMLFTFFAVKFFFELGQKIEIKDLMILIALLQWIIGPILAYQFNPDDQFYYMAVDEATYMNYVVPACMLFIAGLYFPLWNKRTDENVHLIGVQNILKVQPKLDLWLIGIGSIAEIAIDYFPNQIRFAIALIGGTKFIGLYFLILNNRRYKWLIFSFVIAWLALTSINGAMFHDLLLWIGFMVVILVFIFKVSFYKKLIYFIGFLFVIFLIQSVKYEYRKALVQLPEDISRIEIFFQIIQNQFIESSSVSREENTNATITRINQGWIIARIMNYTPKYEPFANGETIIEGIKSSLLPRFLAPDKSVAGGRTYFFRFTGKELSKNTSMGLSPLGEAYANYGIIGGAIFLFVLGCFYNFFIFMIFKIANNHPTIIFFLPLLFLQVVKAETDFVVVLNHLIKASIAVYILYFGMQRILGIKM